jgi:hypothetical protein
MQRIISLLLVCGIFAQSAVRTVWTVHYQWNRAVYLQNCENRDKPAMKCDGKCYLKKKMAVQETRGANAPSLPQQFFEIKDVQLFFEPFEWLIPPPVAKDAHCTFPPFQNLRLLSPPADIFKPPC